MCPLWTRRSPLKRHSRHCECHRTQWHSLWNGALMRPFSVHQASFTAKGRNKIFISSNGFKCRHRQKRRNISLNTFSQLSITLWDPPPILPINETRKNQLPHWHDIPSPVEKRFANEAVYVCPQLNVLFAHTQVWNVKTKAPAPHYLAATEHATPIYAL